MFAGNCMKSLDLNRKHLCQPPSTPEGWGAFFAVNYNKDPEQHRKLKCVNPYRDGERVREQMN